MYDGSESIREEAADPEVKALDLQPSCCKDVLSSINNDHFHPSKNLEHLKPTQMTTVCAGLPAGHTQRGIHYKVMKNERKIGFTSASMSFVSRKRLRNLRRPETLMEFKKDEGICREQVDKVCPRLLQLDCSAED
ncbi:hypothetical protein Leryth_011091 [Lithospermum erythrorhizon]|nr:hypothetical protein Leryth_011091 [Lithospermum erythrorhizon]